MTETASTQLRRILHLVPRIGDGSEHSLDALAAGEGVSAQALLGDLLAIANRLDGPGGFVDPVQITYEPARDLVSVFTSHFLRPMRLTRAELCALELGLAMLRAERPAGEHAAIDAARARLRDVIARIPAGADDAMERHADPAAAGDAAFVAQLRDAREARRKVRIRYLKGDAGTPEPRVVHPYALVASRGAWYLVGHCELADGERNFRLDRMDAVDTLDDGYTLPDGFSLDHLLGDSPLFRTGASEPLRVRYTARIARWIAERHAGTSGPDGSFIVEHPMADVAWAVRHVLQYGPDAEVLAPESVRVAIRERLAAIVRG